MFQINAVLLNFLLSKKPKNKLYSAVFNIIINVFWAANQHIRMIYEGSCDTEDWSNDAKSSALKSQE